MLHSVFAAARLLPETAEGSLISSSEIEGLELNAGRFTGLNGQAATGRDSANGGALESINLIGGTYAISDALSASLYYSDVEVHEATQLRSISSLNHT